jgi:phage I-like protein
MMQLTELPDGDEPAEFRIFKRGVNETTKGPVVFDAAAAASVMAAYTAHGVDLMIDLAHQSIGDSAELREAREDAGDARGWFRLALRNGELWAVDVRWTPDGARRLRERTQRYISPCVYTDKDDRAVEIVNVALCAMPATIGARPLVAASKSFTPKQRARAYILSERIKNGS